MDKYRYRRHIQANQETRWATPEEIRDSATYVDLTAPFYPAAGLPVMSNGREAYVDDQDTHSLIYGATGSKKTRLFVMPMINMFIRAGESFIVTDPKGELYRRSSGMAKEYGYDIKVLNYRDIGKGDCWNPLELPYNLYHAGEEEKATTMINDFIMTLASPQFEQTKDVFWPEMASALALANTLLLMECASKEEANVISLSRLCNIDVKLILKKLSERMSPDTIAGMNLKSMPWSANNTIECIYASLYGMLRVFNTQRDLARVLSCNTIDLTQIGRQKTALYIIVPDEKSTLHFLVTTFIKQSYEMQIAEAQKEKQGKLPIRVNYVLDEFCNIPMIPDMQSMISAARSRNMRYFLVVQSLHQLRGRYKEDADTIKGNCDNLVFLTSRELDLLNEISDLCGTISLANGRERKLISVSELQRLDKSRGEALIMHARQYPFITEIADIDDYLMFKEQTPVPLKDNRYMDCETFSIETYSEQIARGAKPVPFQRVKPREGRRRWL